MFNQKWKAALLTTLMMFGAIGTLFYLHLVPVAKAQEKPTMYLDPDTITDLNISDTFTITVKLTNFTNLYSWQAGLEWDPAALECTRVEFGHAESIFKVLAPGAFVLAVPGAIKNTAGQIYPPYAESLTTSYGVNSTSGVGYELMKVTYRVKGFAPTGINITLMDASYTLWPNVGTVLTPNTIGATIYTITPPTAKPPTANFTWMPPEPVVSENITFDASATTSGFNGTKTIPVTEYRWDFDDDLVWDKTVTTTTVAWSYDIEGDYNVTLEVYAPGIYPAGVPDTGNITKIITISPPPPPPISRTFIYVDPPRINATTTGENVTVYIKIKDFAQLWTWQVGLRWDPTILNCTEVLAGPTFTEGVFNVLAPGRYTGLVPGTINNTAGEIYPPYAETLTIPGEGVNAVPGEVYNLMKITFQVVAPGIVDFHLYETATYYSPDYAEGETTIRDVFTVTLPEGDFLIEIATNSTGSYQKISDHTFSYPENKTSFVITCSASEPHVNGFCNVTIPKALMWNGIDEWTVKVNGETRPILDFKENGTHYFIHFTYTHKTNGKPAEPHDNLIEIISPHVIPEFLQSWMLITLLITALTIALAKMKLKTLKTKHNIKTYSTHTSS